MLLSKKPAALIPSYTSLPSFYHSPFPSCLMSCCHQRFYAQHAAEPSSQPASRPHPHPLPHPHNGLEEDLAWPLHEYPTPYQILAARRGQVYTKHRFIALAKLYHPDRSHVSSPVAHLPQAVRLERYRLLVAAHTILSDDSKRRAYDLWGSGWVGSHHSALASSPYAYAEQRHWPSDHDPINNATWEDWEHWYDREYQRDRKADPRTIQMSNFGFLSLVFALVTVGGIMQGTRANMFSATIVEHRDKMHKEASMELAKSKRATMSGGDRNERIRTFIEHREASLPGGGEAHQRLLPPEGICSPESLEK